MLQALVDHERDPKVLAELARGRMRPKVEQLAEALEGRFNDHHRFMVSFRLARIDQTSRDVEQLDRRVDELIEREGLVVARDLLVSIPGESPRVWRRLSIQEGSRAWQHRRSTARS
ncbi:MAG TPA: hypothetical protein VF635_06855, partial [Propionibacteriaceae bacterium]